MRRARRFGLLVAIWSVPAALMAVQTYTYGGPDDYGQSASRALLREAPPWLLWVIATPFILRAAARRHPLRGWNLAGHVARAAAIALVFGVANGVLAQLVRAVPSADSWWDAIVMGVLDWLPFQPLLYAGVLATGIALEGARRRRQDEVAQAQLEAQLATARLDALRNQLQPHFLFNTLNAAVTLARAGDSEGTVAVLVRLGELLRELLREPAPHEVPLRDELRLLEAYLDIQRVRFGDRLRVEWDIADGVRDALVPPLVLQPLVENALQHGLARRAAAGRIEIVAERAGEDLALSVRDDGPGPEASPAFGLGLRTTLARLRQLYGERGKLELANAGDGAVAAVTLPLRHEATDG